MINFVPADTSVANLRVRKTSMGVEVVTIDELRVFVVELTL